MENSAPKQNLIFEPPPIFESSIVSRKYDIYITGEIKAPNVYLDVFDKIRNAAPNDLIRIIINSGGGDFYTAMQLVGCLEQTQAHTIGIIDGECHSAASFIFLQCREFEVPEYASMLCHYYTTGHSGKGHEIKSWQNYFEPFIADLFTNIYQDFCTPKEIEDMINGKDLWLRGTEIIERLNNKVKEADKRELKATKGKKK